MKSTLVRYLLILLMAAPLLTSCASLDGSRVLAAPLSTPTATALPTSTPQIERPHYKPGELVDYTAQTGDTLPALAAHFNTTVEEILQANPIIPPDATTLPPGLPMKIPIYYLPLWGSQFHILPDHAFINGPTQIGFDTVEFVAGHEGWLKDYVAYAGGANRSGAEIVDYVATNFSISPRLLLAILEYQAGALSLPEPPKEHSPYTLGHRERFHRGMYLQLVWAANTLNNGYYGWRTGHLTAFDLPDGRMVRPDPWQNAASVALQYYFAQLFSGEEYTRAIGPDGLLKTYRALFGDPWQEDFVLIPGSLRQPDLTLPFPSGRTWNYTGGPHTGFGEGEPYAAVDFAPPSEHSGCFVADSQQYAVAMADGPIVRTGTGLLVQDLDGDGEERTGWTLIYLHIATSTREHAAVGQFLHAGDPIGYPSCEGGHATGTHVHIARKYNGEWIPADGPLAFTLEGWTVHNGDRPYEGTLTKGGLVITACECADLYSQITAGLNLLP